MHTSIQTRLKLGGFVQRALDSLATQNPVNVWGHSTPQIEKAADAARLRMCALAHAFHQAGKAEELAKRASDERSHQIAGLLLQLGLQAWSVERRRMGWRVEVTEEGTAAWNSLRENLQTFFLGGSEAV